MTKRVTLDDLPSIKLENFERLNLFDEYSCDMDELPFYKDGWRNKRSMNDYRFVDKDDLCKSISWLAKPIEIQRIVHSISSRCADENSSLNELNDLISSYEIGDAKLEYKMNEHLRNYGYHDCTTFDIYEVRKETPEEFSVRKKWQERYINKVLKNRKILKEKEKNCKKETRKKIYEKLKKEFEDA